MSFVAAAWAISCRRVANPRQKMVLIVLADCHNAETGRCDPSIGYIAEMAMMSRRSVQQSLSELESLGLISRVNRFGDDGQQSSNAYQLHVSAEAQPVREDCTGSVQDLHTGGAGSARRGCKSRTGGVQDLHPNLELNQEYNQERNQEYKRAREARVVPRPPDVDDHVWTDYVAQRKAQRAPVTQTAIERIRTQADLAGVSMQEALETCLERGWRGFKAEWIAAPAPRAGSRRVSDPEGRISDLTASNIRNLAEYLR